MKATTQEDQAEVYRSVPEKTPHNHHNPHRGAYATNIASLSSRWKDKRQFLLDHVII